MALGQQSGPPAGARLVQQLVDLVVAAGFDDLRDARHPLGLTQRQAGGKFTVAECEDLIARLAAQTEGKQTECEQPTAAETAPGAAAVPPAMKETVVTRTRTAQERDAARATALQRVPTEMLAGELQRRGWIVIEP